MAATEIGQNDFGRDLINLKVYSFELNSSFNDVSYERIAMNFEKCSSQSPILEKYGV